MARAGRRVRQRRRALLRSWQRARQEMGRLDDEESQASEWSEPDESDSDNSLLLDGFSSDSNVSSDSDDDEVSVGPLDGVAANTKVLGALANDRFRAAVKALAAHPECWRRFGIIATTGTRPIVQGVDGSYRTLLHHAVAFEREPRVTELLLRWGADVDARDNEGLTPLHRAAKRAGNERTIVCLLEHGAAMNANDDSGRTPLMLAARRDHKSNCEALIAAGADVDTFDLMKGWTALKFAVRQPFARCVAPLLDAGATLDRHVFDIAMKRGSTRGLYQLLLIGGVEWLRHYCEEMASEGHLPRFYFIGRPENVVYMRIVHSAGGLEVYERDEGRKLVSLLRRHVAPRAPDDVLHVIVSFWGHPGSY